MHKVVSKCVCIYFFNLMFFLQVQSIHYKKNKYYKVMFPLNIKLLVSQLSNRLAGNLLISASCQYQPYVYEYSNLRCQEESSTLSMEHPLSQKKRNLYLGQNFPTFLELLPICGTGSSTF